MACVTLLNQAHASPYQSQESIYQAVREYVDFQTSHLDPGRVEIQISQLDPRLNLGACNAPLEIFTLSDFRPVGSNHIGVKCNGPTAWKIYIPVNILIFEDIIVAANPLPRRDIVGESDILIVRKEISSLNGGYITDPNEVIGKEVSRPLQMGAPLTKNALANQKLVQRGQQVTMIISSGGLNVSATGKALMHGGLGDLIKVSNSHSQRVIEGTVIAHGTVEIRL